MWTFVETVHDRKTAGRSSLLPSPTTNFIFFPSWAATAWAVPTARLVQCFADSKFIDCSICFLVVEDPIRQYDVFNYTLVFVDYCILSQWSWQHLCSLLSLNTYLLLPSWLIGVLRLFCFGWEGWVKYICWSQKCFVDCCMNYGHDNDNCNHHAHTPPPSPCIAVVLFWVWGGS